jgi:hypothetical protein
MWSRKGTKSVQLIRQEECLSSPADATHVDGHTHLPNIAAALPLSQSVLLPTQGVQDNGGEVKGHAISC